MVTNLVHGRMRWKIKRKDEKQIMKCSDKEDFDERYSGIFYFHNRRLILEFQSKQLKFHEISMTCD